MVLERIISPDNYKGSYLKATLFGIIITAIGLTIGYNLRFLPSLNKFKKLIDENLIGDIYS